LLQPRQCGNQQGVVALALLPGHLDRAQDLTHRIHHVQERGRDFRGQRKLPIPQASQQVLSHMSDGFQFVVTEKTAGPFDGVNRAKYTGQSSGIVRIFLQPDQFPVQPIQILVTLD